MRSGSRANLIATLGVEPQVVTLALDWLLAKGEAITEAVVVYTTDRAVLAAYRIVEAEFRSGSYPAVTLRPVLVVGTDGPVEDFRNPGHLRALLGTLYREVRRVRGEGGTVHLLVSGGRKVMGIMAMVVAQLLFGPEDRVWHLITEGWQPGGSRRLHWSPGEESWLVPVPVLRWSEAATLLSAVAELDDPEEVVRWYERLSLRAKEREKEYFLRYELSPAERAVVRLACQGLDNEAIARALNKSRQTVANQLRRVYEKLREWLGYPEGPVDRRVLIAQFAPYFAALEQEKGWR
ncbi:MAG: CRISPR-associated protein Csx14 [Moorellales bacterium]